MNCNLRAGKIADGNAGGTGAARRVTAKAAFLPHARKKTAMALQIGQDRQAAGQAYLPAVRVTAQVKMRSRFRGFTRDVRRMCQ